MEAEDDEGDPVVEDTLITVTDKVKEIDGILTAGWCTGGQGQ
ncbi:MAG: hypothetical protein R3E84_21680 [Pseudomonadales bacterium]